MKRMAQSPDRSRQSNEADCKLSDVRSPSFLRRRLALSATIVVLIATSTLAVTGDLASLSVDRAAIEQVYYEHRLGNKPPFAQMLPPALIEKLVRQDLQKEAVLKKAYGVKLTRAEIEAEVRRINSTTRAPEILAEIKKSLGDDPERFAHSVAKPIVVERELRMRFENDDRLHAPQRQQAEQTRRELLAAKASGGNLDQLLLLLQRSHSNAVSEATWQLAARTVETNTPVADEIEIKKRFGPDAQILSPPHAAGDQNGKLYFAELRAELQNVLRAQLRQPGDVSAVIETPGGFLLYLAKDKTAATLSAAVLSIPKRSYEQWLNEQQESNP